MFERKGVELVSSVFVAGALIWAGCTKSEAPQEPTAQQEEPQAAEAEAADDKPAAKTAKFVVAGEAAENWAESVKALAGKAGVTSVSADAEKKLVVAEYTEGSEQDLVSLFQQEANLAVAPVGRIEIAVEGMQTPNCPVLVKKTVGTMDGVLGVEASLESMSAVIEHVPGSVTTDEVVALLKDRTGFVASAQVKK